VAFASSGNLEIRSHAGRWEAQQVMIAVEKDAAEYIRSHTGAVVIGLHFEPSLGGCVCSTTKITGSYVPVISIGKPPVGEKDQYELQLVENVEVYFPPGLDVKQGYAEIKISLRGRLWFRWLELEGAKGIACYTG
jgi:hypothetical protein